MNVRDRMLANCESVEQWAALGNDTSGPSMTNTHVMGTHAITYGKVDGAANTKIAAIYRSIQQDLLTVNAVDRICWVQYVGDVTNLDYSFVRLGTDASNYAEYRFADSSHNDGAWTVCSARFGEPSTVVGEGINQRNVLYLCTGTAWDAEGNTGTLVVDEIFIAKANFNNS